MYVHPAFDIHPATSLAFAGARGFGLVVACDAGRPVASPLPFILVQQDGKPARVRFHVARANPLAELAARGGVWLLAVQGHDAYVSPDWYDSPDQVPTWLYEAVHLSGPVQVVPPEHLQAHLDELGDQFEQWLAPKRPWTADKVTPKRLEMLKKAIVAIEMIVETVEGNFKLNQHKQDADHVAVATQLMRAPEPGGRAIGARMVGLRPHLAYGPAQNLPRAAAPLGAATALASVED
jgi:transcriptional regulator